MIARIPHFTGDRNDRRVLEIEAAENTHRIEWLQNQILIFAGQCIAQIEGNYLGLVIRRLKANNFRVLLYGSGNMSL